MKSKWLPWALAGLLLVLLIVALYSSGKCPRRCYFPEFCEELAIPMPKDGVLPAPVTMEREVGCPCGVKVKYFAEFEWKASGELYSLYFLGGAEGFGQAREFWREGSRTGKTFCSAITPFLRHTSFVRDCGRHDSMFFMIANPKHSTDDKLAVDVGIGYPREVFGGGWSETPVPSVWGKALANVRYAVTMPDALINEKRPLYPTMERRLPQQMNR